MARVILLRSCAVYIKVQSVKVISHIEFTIEPPDIVNFLIVFEVDWAFYTVLSFQPFIHLLFVSLVEPNHPSCSVSDKCIRTCASPNPANCPYKPPKTNKDGCECMEGYILSKKGGKCIRIEDCPSKYNIITILYISFINS